MEQLSFIHLTPLTHGKDIPIDLKQSVWGEIGSVADIKLPLSTFSGDHYSSGSFQCDLSVGIFIIAT